MIPVYAPRRRAPMERRRLPPRPDSCAHYQQVTPLVDSGLTARRCTQLHSRLRHYCRVRSDEVFRRVSAETLVRLIVDVQRLLLSAESEREAPYLLLDVRDEAVYRAAHVLTARHFSPRRLARTLDYDTAAMREYRARSDTVIVLYDEDERTAASCATALTQRGYDNVFLLSGGLRLASALFPAALLQSSAEENLCEEQMEQLERALQQCRLPASCSRPQSVTNVSAPTPSAGRRSPIGL